MSNFSCFSPNLSHDSLTFQAWSVHDHGEGPVRNVNAIAAFLLLFFLLGVPWNILVIVLTVKKRLYTQPGIILLLNLAIADLLLCVLVLPFNIVSGIAGEYVFGNSDAVRCVVCQTGIFLTLLTFMSFHTVTLMSIDRLLYLLKPLEYSSIVTPKRTLLVILATWILCITLSILPLFKFGEIEFGVVVGACTLLLLGSGQTPTNINYITLLLSEVAVVILVLIAANIAILIVVKKHFRKVYNMRRSFFDAESGSTNTLSKLTATKNKVQIYLLRMLGAILLTNFVLLFPVIVLAIAGSAIAFERIPQPYVSFSYLVFISQAVVHPLLESIFVSEITSAFSHYCKCLCWKKIRKNINTPVAAITANTRCQDQSTKCIQTLEMLSPAVNHETSNPSKCTRPTTESPKHGDVLKMDFEHAQYEMPHTSCEGQSPQEPLPEAYVSTGDSEVATIRVLCTVHAL